jgi:fermentation-respiration switch protein FrsA (DUF1100 family)
LILVSAFTSLRDAVRERFFLGLLAPFVWYHFSTIDYVRLLQKTNLLIIHGAKDRLISPAHSAKLEQAYRGAASVRRILCPRSGHNGVFSSLRDELRKALTTVLSAG